MSSVRAIARKAGVSITTVSRALNNDPAVNARTREHVLKVANRCGYVASIGRRVTTNLGFAYTAEMTLGFPFDAAVFAGVNRGVDECRFDVLVLHLLRDKEPDESYTQFFLRKGVRGVLLRTNAATRQICEKIAEEGFPHVVLSERFDEPGVNWIDCDSRPDSVRAVEYLISLGHRRIAFVMNNTPDRDHLDRYSGYQEALANAGLPLEPALVFTNQFTMGGGATVVKLVLGMAEPPTAIFFADPMMAVGAMREAHSLGLRIPQDLSIIGFDDGDLRYSVYPTLTAVCQDAARLGFEAAAWLARSITAGNGVELRKIMPSFFSINHSVAPPASAGSRFVAAEAAGAVLPAPVGRVRREPAAAPLAAVRRMRGKP